MKQTTSTHPRLAAVIALALFVDSAAFVSSGQPVSEGNLPQPKLVSMDKLLSADQAQKTVHAAKVFYEFWNTGDPQFARLALATNFTDRTLPKGRPQGVDGPLFASRSQGGQSVGGDCAGLAPPCSGATNGGAPGSSAGVAQPIGRRTARTSGPIRTPVMGRLF